jgi:Holliday junction resolvase-like predicted endonuclease
MSNTITGQKAEQAAVVYLEMRGYSVLEQNFRRPRCEIDIVAKKDGIVYFVEVKYRATNAQGGGLEAITATKLRQMQFAAEIWVQDTKWAGPYQLAAVEVGGPTFAIEHFIDNVL